MEETSDEPALAWNPVTTSNLCTNLLYPLMLELTAIYMKAPPCNSEPFPLPFITYRSVKYALSRHHKGGPVPFLFQRPLSVWALPLRFFRIPSLW